MNAIDLCALFNACHAYNTLELGGNIIFHIYPLPYILEITIISFFNLPIVFDSSNIYSIIYCIFWMNIMYLIIFLDKKLDFSNIFLLQPMLYLIK